MRNNKKGTPHPLQTMQVRIQAGRHTVTNLTDFGPGDHVRTANEMLQLCSDDFAKATQRKQSDTGFWRSLGWRLVLASIFLENSGLKVQAMILLINGATETLMEGLSRGCLDLPGAREQFEAGYTLSRALASELELQAIEGNEGECDIQAVFKAALADSAVAAQVATGLFRWFRKDDLSILLYRAITLQAEHDDRLVGLEPVLLPARASVEYEALEHSMGLCPLRVPRTEELESTGGPSPTRPKASGAENA